ncbi:MAG: TPM domain-containing protein [Solirubrobacterales bacterium]
MKTFRGLLNKHFIGILCAASISLFTFSSVFAANYPKPTELKYVNDYTGNTIDESTKEYIISVGKELEDKTGAQEVIVVINSLEGADINSYANELFRNWGIGQKGKNNGLMILLSMQDRAWRVEVGTGLEGAVTDIYSSRIMNSVALPLFKEGNYSQGLKDSFSVFADDIAKEYNVTLDKNEKVNVPKDNSNNSNPFDSIGFVIFIIIIWFLFFRRRRGGFFGGGFFGGGGFGGGSSGGGFGGFGGGSSSGGGSSGRF